MSRRVAMVLPVFPRASETFIVSKFLGLLERGWDVHVVCRRRDDRAWALYPGLVRDPALRARVHTTWPTEPRWKARALLPVAFMSCLLAAPATTLAYLRKMARAFRWGAFRRLYLDAMLLRLRPDLVHFEFGALATRRMHLAEALGCRMVVSFRGYDLNYVGLEDEDHYEAIWRRADALHFLGEDLWRRAQRRGCPPGKAHVLIPPAIDVGFFSPNRPPTMADADRPLRILSVGRLEWKKGYEDALVAVRKLLDRGLRVEYRIIGEGSFLGGLSFARHQLGLEDSVAFLGSGGREHVRSEMQEADVLLHAAVSEGFCNAVLEAQSMQLPVVCTDADGLPENVENGVTGIVVPRRQPPSLADALARLAADPGLRRRMGEAGRRRVTARFRIEDQISAFDSLYRAVLEGRPPVASAPESEASGVPA